MSTLHSIFSANAVPSSLSHNPAQPALTTQSAPSGIDFHSGVSHLHSGIPPNPALSAHPPFPAQPSLDTALQHRGLDFTLGNRLYPQLPQTSGNSRIVPQADSVHTLPVPHPAHTALFQPASAFTSSD